ncbi:hypothetical protein KAV67_04350, partial [Candidatus Bipolaricaulota bacterium]|nr:hypothetical protein [Candidatus Bipolaricaulota bacterium]
MKQVSTKRAPKPLGHYSHAMLHGDMVHISGQLPVDPATGEWRIGSIKKQTARILKNRLTPPTYEHNTAVIASRTAMNGVSSLN